MKFTNLHTIGLILFLSSFFNFSYAQTAEDYYEQGKLEIDNKNYDKAIENFEKALEIKSDYVLANNYIGYTYRVKKEYEKAKDIFTKSIEMDSENSYAYYMRGYTYFKNLKNRTQAKKDFLKALEIKPNYAKPAEYMGDILYDEGKLEEATKYYDIAIEANPDDSYLYYSRALSIYSEDGLYAALSDIETVIELGGEDWYLSQAYTFRGLYYLQQLGNVGLIDAMSDFQKAIELDSKNAYAYNNMGTAYIRMGDLSLAIEYIEKAIELNPNEPIFQENLDKLD